MVWVCVIIFARLTIGQSEKLAKGRIMKSYEIIVKQQGKQVRRFNHVYGENSLNAIDKVEKIVKRENKNQLFIYTAREEK